LISDKATFEQLTTTEQNLWTKFETADIYRFLTGEEDTVPEFQYNWTSIPKLQPLGPTLAGPATLPHSFNIDDLVWYEDFSPLGKYPKLMPKWSGPAKITEINDTNARILLPNGKSKVLNVMRLKKIFAEKKPDNSDSDKSATDNLHFNSEQNISRPMTRALKKLIDHKNVA
jgi:hypothetical protein